MFVFFFVGREITTFIFFLLNLQGISFKVMVFVTNSRKIISLQKRYILKYLYIFKLLCNNWKFLPCTQTPHWTTWHKEPKPNRICSYTKSEKLSLQDPQQSGGTPPPILLHLSVCYLLIINLKVCILTVPTKKSYWRRVWSSTPPSSLELPYSAHNPSKAA